MRLFYSKRGFFNWDDPKTVANLIVGFLILALGIIPLLNGWGVIGFTLPGFLSGIVMKIVHYIIAALGLWLLIDAFMEDSHMRMITLLVALAVLAVGIIPLLNTFGVIGFTIPFLTVALYNIIFVIEGIFLIIAAFATF